MLAKKPIVNNNFPPQFLSTPNPSKQSIILIRVYLCRKITSPLFFDSFSEDAITLLSRYIYTLLCRLIGKIRTILALQRRTIPNCLHGIMALHNLGIKIDRLMEYLNKKLSKNQAGNNLNIRNMYKGQSEMSGLMQKLLEDQKVQEIQRVNIYHVPNFCIPPVHFLPVQVNFTNYLPRPHPMCHAKRRDIIEKSGKRDFESLEKNRIKGENQMKVCLGKLRKIKKADHQSYQQNTDHHHYEQNSRNQRQSQLESKQKERPKKVSKFNACQYL